MFLSISEVMAWGAELDDLLILSGNDPMEFHDWEAENEEYEEED